MRITSWSESRRGLALGTATALLGLAVTVLILLQFYQDEMLTQRHVASMRHLGAYDQGTKPLVYIPTREGLTSRYRQLEVIHSNLQAHNRSVLLVNQASVHYQDIKVVNFCEIFELPSTIECMDLDVKKTIRSLKCIMPPLPEGTSREQEQWLFKPSKFGIETFNHVVDTSLNWSSTQCGLIYGNYWPVVKSQDFIPIRFRPRYRTQFQQALHNLLVSFDGDGDAAYLNVNSSMKKVASRSPSIHSLKYTSKLHPIEVSRNDFFLVALHWRRGDQANSRCKNHEDNSNNCHSALQFVSSAHQYVQSLFALMQNQSHWLAPFRERKCIIFVGTNEDDQHALQILRNGGLKIFRDTGFGGKVNSLEEFLIETQIMIEADVFYGEGVTGVQPFIHRSRAERGKVAP